MKKVLLSAVLGLSILGTTISCSRDNDDMVEVVEDAQYSLLVGVWDINEAVSANGEWTTAKGIIEHTMTFNQDKTVSVLLQGTTYKGKYTSKAAGSFVIEQENGHKPTFKIVSIKDGVLEVEITSPEDTSNPLKVRFKKRA